MALLDMLAGHGDSRIVVAHFDHGIRSDSAEDRKLVQAMARKYGLQFVYDEGRLGLSASEATAREARYAFLQQVRAASGADAIITAHHQDDLLETAIHNLLRGTNWRGLVSLRSRGTVERPLLNVPKATIVNYAKEKDLAWREDSTNSDMRYRRNYIRHVIMPKLSVSQKEALLQHIRTVSGLQQDIDTELANHLHLHPSQSELDRHWFIMLPHTVAREVLATWLRRHNITDLSGKLLERLLVAAKTYAPGNRTDVDRQYIMIVDKHTIKLSPRTR